MTIKEFYQWAVEHGVEDFEMGNEGWDGYSIYEASDKWDTDWTIDRTKEVVYTRWEC